MPGLIVSSGDEINAYAGPKMLNRQRRRAGNAAQNANQGSESDGRTEIQERLSRFGSSCSVLDQPRTRRPLRVPLETPLAMPNTSPDANSSIVDGLQLENFELRKKVRTLQAELAQFRSLEEQLAAARQNKTEMRERFRKVQAENDQLREQISQDAVREVREPKEEHFDLFNKLNALIESKERPKEEKPNEKLYNAIEQLITAIEGLKLNSRVQSVDPVHTENPQTTHTPQPASTPVYYAQAASPSHRPTQAYAHSRSEDQPRPREASPAASPAAPAATQMPFPAHIPPPAGASAPAATSLPTHITVSLEPSPALQTLLALLAVPELSTASSEDDSHTMPRASSAGKEYLERLKLSDPGSYKQVGAMAREIIAQQEQEPSFQRFAAEELGIDT